MYRVEPGYAGPEHVLLDPRDPRRNPQYQKVPSGTSPAVSNVMGAAIIVAALGCLVLVFLVKRGTLVFGQGTEGLPPPAFPVPTDVAANPVAPEITSIAPEEDCTKGPCKRVFYMYRAQDNTNYPMQNVNTASLAGVMWYLHNEVIKTTPRKYNITRVLRLKVTAMTTQAWWNSHFTQFGPFMAFDGARCNVPNCDNFWDTYGFIIGCQASQLDVANYRSYGQSIRYCQPGQCNAPVWYSLPGPCPSQDFSVKTDECIKRYPGGFCFSSYNETTGLGDPNDWKVTGAWNCTFHVEWAGEVLLDELVGIQDYNTFFFSGMKEYEEWTDRGVGTDFWNGIHNETACRERMEKMRWAFHQSAQHLDIRLFPFDLPEPMCDAP